MDSSLAEAARALAVGNPLRALNEVALRSDAAALALRGSAMAQLGDYVRARSLLRRAARAFGARRPVARARCHVAEAEIALATRDLGNSMRILGDACRTLETAGDRVNARHGRLIAARRLLLLGRIDDAAGLLDKIDLKGAPASLVANRRLLLAEIALRRLKPDWARTALRGALAAARRSGIPALAAETEEVSASLDLPAARLVTGGTERTIVLTEVASVLGSRAVVVDACRRVVRRRRDIIDLARRPVLFHLVQRLALAWPDTATRDELIAHVFDVRRPNESHRARLRVEVGRLRRELRGVAGISATTNGFRLIARAREQVVVLVPPIEGTHGELLALLADGTAWSTSALALALGSSQRSVQRALSALEEAGQVRSFGRARRRRWLGRHLSGFTPVLLLPPARPIG